jgi:hypothetical protein
VVFAFLSQDILSLKNIVLGSNTNPTLIDTSMIVLARRLDIYFSVRL